MTEPLQFLPVERWGELKLKADAYFPKSLSILTVLETQEYILKQGLDYGFKVYCPYGEVGNGMVAFNLKNGYYEVIVLCLSDEPTELERALRTTALIDWSRPLEVPYGPKPVADLVKRIFNDKNIKIDSSITTHTFFIDKDSSLFDVSLPPGLSFELLPLDYVELVNSVWPHRFDGSEWYFEMLIKAKLGYGLFKEGELVAWSFVKEMGALGHLFTLENHRNKGYGELVLKLISNVLLKNKKHVYGYCITNNIRAYNLYVKLGFTNLFDVEWNNIYPKSAENLDRELALEK